MSHANYQNIYIFPAETNRFNAEKFSLHSRIDDTAALLVSKTLAEANAEEILEVILDNTFDVVCPHIPRCMQLSNKYDKPIVTTPSQSNILSVLEMENNLPGRHKTANTYHSNHSCQTSDTETLEEPVFTSPIYVKSGPENINILEEITKPVDSTSSECTGTKELPVCNLENSSDLQDASLKNNDGAEVISLTKENNRMLCYGSDSKINIMGNEQINNNECVKCSENIGDANGIIDNNENLKDNEKVSRTDLNVSAVSQIIGDVVLDLPGSVKDTHPQIVQAYVLYPDAPAPNTTTAKNENTLTTEMEGNSAEHNKEVNTTSSNNETLDTETRPTRSANDLGDLIDYFQQVDNVLEEGLMEVPGDKSNESIESSPTSEEVKRAVQEIAAVLEGQGDGTPHALSTIGVQLAGRREESSLRTLEPTPSTLNTEREEEIAVHGSLDDEAALQNFLSEMHKRDEMEEKEIQVILHSDEEEVYIYTDTAFDSETENSPLSEYFASAQKDSQEDLTDISYRSFSNLDLCPSRTYIDPSKLKCVVEEIYSLEKMTEKIRINNPKLKTKLTIDGTRVQLVEGPVNTNVMKTEENLPTDERDTKWSRLRKFLACGAFKCSTQTSDEPQNM